jgi:formylglycine-generating enzyme required for sulfatase activity
MGAEGKVVAAAFESYCPAGYAWVPGSAKYGTMPGFCISAKEQGEMSQGNGTATDTPPLANISWYEAKDFCQAIGDGYHLITEPEWLTLAENLANASSFNLGTSSEKTLSSKEKVYDLASGLAEWVDELAYSDNDKPEPKMDSWQEYPSITDYHQFELSKPDNGSWSAINGIGMIKSVANNSISAAVRGGNDADGQASGLWSLRLDKKPDYKGSEIGFRCTK